MKPAWITGPDAGRVNPLAAARWRPLAGRPSAASNDPDSFGASGVTKPCSVWKCSGAMTDGRSYSLTQLSTLQETEMRPLKRGHEVPCLLSFDLLLISQSQF